MRRHFLHLGIALFLAILVALVYFPGLRGPYILDDEENITLSKDVALTEITPESLYDALWSNHSGPLKRPLAALSFSLNYYFEGNFENTLPYKLTNVVIHVINGWLVYYLLFLLLRGPVLASDLTREQQQYIAGFSALLWAVHPVQLTSVLYVVQRMNSLSALFVILGLIAFVRGRQSLDDSGKHGFWLMLAGVICGTLLGIGAKENAVLLPLFAFVIEITLFNYKSLPSSLRMQLGAFYIATLLTPLVLFIFYLAANPEFLLDAYAMRPFSLYERLLTESRVLWFYASLLFLPNIQRLGLFHDDIPVSTGLLDPFLTLPAVLGLLVVLTFTIFKSRRYPVACFAILWFLAGHSLESSVFGLEIAYEHRNYLPSVGVALAVACLIFRFLTRTKNHGAGRILMALPYSIIIVFAFSTWAWANVWKDPLSLALHHVTHHPGSIRSISYAANIFIREKSDLARAIRYTMDGIHISPDESGLRLDLQLYLAYFAFEINSELGKRDIRMSGRSFQIPDLPDSITVKNVAGRIELSFQPSSSDVINDMLRSKVISVHGVVALEKLTKCITDKIAYCQSLQQNARKWIATATTNPRTTSDYQAILSANAGRLYAHTGDYGRALDYITTASRLSPRSVYYELNKAEYLIKLGRLNEADTLLNRIEESAIELRKIRETINLLRKMQADVLKTRG